jgi:EmrB/QacA subfamily drug resistance transporter
MIVLSGLMLGMLLAALDQMIVSTAMRTIADHLHGQTLQAWATTAYLITATVSTPLYGKLSDIYGRKPMYLTAITIFLVGSLASGAAQTMYQLAVFRAIQGAGAGGLMSLAIAIIGDMVPPRERAKYTGFFMAVFGIASVAGPILGGLFAGLDTFVGIEGWRWVFLVNVPIGVLAWFVVNTVLNIPHRRRDHRIDYWGALALSVAVVPLLVVAEQGREWGWGSGRVIGLVALALVGLVSFIGVERRMGDEALLPLRLFRSSVFSVGNALSFIVGMGMFGGMILLPLYLQIVKNMTPTAAGLNLLPLMLGIMICVAGSGVITAKTGRYKIFPVLGTGFMVLALLLFSTIDVDTPLWQTSLIMALMGAGLGGCMQTLVMAVQNDVPPRDMGVATASATFFRQMGGAAGTAVFLSVLFTLVGDKIADAMRSAFQTDGFRTAVAQAAQSGDPTTRGLAESLTGQGGAMPDLNDTSFLQHLDPALARPFLEGFSTAMSTAFVVAAGTMAVAFVLSFFLKEKVLATKSGMELVADEDAAIAAAKI